MWSIIFHVSRLHSSKTLPTIVRSDFTSNISSAGKYFKYFHQRHAYNLCSLCGHKPLTLRNELPNSKQRYSISRSNSLFTSHVVQKNKEYDDKQLKDIGLLFPSPKTVLNNYYMIVSNELDIQNPVTIHYKSLGAKKSTGNKIEWSCTYSVKWPSEYKTIASAATKAEASRKAALKLLVWLNAEGKILRNGQPILYDRDEVKQIKARTYVQLDFDEDTKRGLEKIRAEYETIKMQMELAPDSDESANSLDEVGCVEDIGWSAGRRENSSIKNYKAVESMKLPIREYKQEIERLLEEKRIVIIRGEPGCGKSSYVPQYLLESWYREHPNHSAKIAVTQPRRIAAISLAENVAAERGERAGDVVGYQVRLRSQYDPRTTRILYLTTGVLLRWMQRDPSLSSCTHVVVDEAHERDVNIDLLLCMLKRALVENPHLKICIMSATVDAKLFSSYFGNAPVVHVHGRKFPVQKYHLKEVARKLRLHLDRTMSVNESDRTEVVAEEIADVLHRLHMTADEGAILCFLPGWDEIGRVQRSLVRRSDLRTAIVLPLHGRLSNEEQRRIFEKAPPGSRKIILATNVAETSITVDDVVHVVDSGLHRLHRFDPERRLSSSRTEWINKSNAEQRAGRAGRVRPGFCYRLFTTERHRSMDDYPTPEMLRAPLDKVLLDAKVFSRNADAFDLFGKLPSPPSAAVVKSAVTELQRLQLLDEEGNVTRFGRLVSHFPMSPRLARSLVQSVTYGCVGPIVDIVTIFGNDSSEMFSSALADKRAVRETKLAHCSTSDHIALALLYERWASLVAEGNTHEVTNFCKKYNLLPYKLHTLRKLRYVHLQYLESCLENSSELTDECSNTEEIIKGVLLSGVGNVLSHRSWDVVKGRLKRSNVFVTSSGHKATVTPESVNAKDAENESLFVYVNEVKSELRRSVLVRETSLIDPLTLLLFHGESLRRGHSPEKDDDDNVLLRINNTNVKFLCPVMVADLIEECRTALRHCENYFVRGYSSSPDVDFRPPTRWYVILQTLKDIFRSR